MSKQISSPVPTPDRTPPTGTFACSIDNLIHEVVEAMAKDNRVYMNRKEIIAQQYLSSIVFHLTNAKLACREYADALRPSE